MQTKTRKKKKFAEELKQKHLLGNYEFKSFNVKTSAKKTKRTSTFIVSLGNFMLLVSFGRQKKFLSLK